MRSATRSADMPGPGSRFGQEVTMRHFSVSARAIEGAATAPASVTPAPDERNGVAWVMAALHRCVEMMQRPVAVADLECIGAGDGGSDVALRRLDGGDEVEALGQPRRNRR